MHIQVALWWNWNKSEIYTCKSFCILCALKLHQAYAPCDCSQKSMLQKTQHDACCHFSPSHPLSPPLTFCRHALTQYYSCHMPLLCFVATNLPCLAYLVNYLGLLALDYFLSLLLFSLLHFLLLLLLLHLLLLVGFWCCKVSNFSRLSSDWFGTIMFTYLNAACGMLSHSRRKSTWIFLADSPWQISQSWLALCLCVSLCVCVGSLCLPVCLCV